MAGASRRENAFLRAKKLQERKLLYQVSKIILLEESQDILFRQGDESTSYFIVLHGELNCIVSTDNEGEMRQIYMLLVG